MTLHELEAEALKLSETERIDLVARIRASLHAPFPPKRDRSIYEMGTNPVDLGPTDASVNLDKYLCGTPDTR